MREAVVVAAPVLCVSVCVFRNECIVASLAIKCDEIVVVVGSVVSRLCPTSAVDNLF